MSNVERKELVALKAKLKRRAKSLDINLFGVADVARWESRPVYDGAEGIAHCQNFGSKNAVE